MAKQSLTLKSLERIVAADDDRRLAMAALAGLREVTAGDHYSAMVFDATNCKIADYFLDQGWLAADHTFWQIAQRGLADHPLAATLLSQHQSMTLVRSRVISNAAWTRTWIYNELELPLGVKDTASVCQYTSSGQVLILTCGRSRKFKDDEIDTVRSYHRVLSSLAPFQSRAPRPTYEPSVAPSAINPMVRLAALTLREREVHRWLRQGKRDLEIAIILGISQRTIHHHVARVLRKLGVETRTAAALS